MLDMVEAHDLIDATDPVQFSIRLLSSSWIGIARSSHRYSAVSRSTGPGRLSVSLDAPG